MVSHVQPARRSSAARRRFSYVSACLAGGRVTSRGVWPPMNTPLLRGIMAYRVIGRQPHQRIQAERPSGAPLSPPSVLPGVRLSEPSDVTLSCLASGVEKPVAFHVVNASDGADQDVVVVQDAPL